MLRIWIVCFLVLFALAELYQWLKHVSLPIPIHILGGAFLAIASNFDKLFGVTFLPITSTSEEIAVPTPAPIIPSSPSPPANHPTTSELKSVELPKLPLPTTPNLDISISLRSPSPKQDGKRMWQLKNNQPSE